MNREFRRTIIAGNWKMNTLASQVSAYSQELLKLSQGFHEWCDVVICTPFTALEAAVKSFNGSDVLIGAQNMSQHESGAYTGEVSREQLIDLGVRYVIIGHSERREYYAETNETVNQKVTAALQGEQLLPIMCVGESLEQREIGITKDLIAMQVKSGLYGITAEQMSRVVIAYEPIWAIGTGKTATPEDAQEVCGFIREVLSDNYGDVIARSVSILYGGSMNDKNAGTLLAQPDIDGGLVGGASLKPEQFAVIINAANQ